MNFTQKTFNSLLVGSFVFTIAGLGVRISLVSPENNIQIEKAEFSSLLPITERDNLNMGGLRFETSRSCGPDRSYFENSLREFKKIDRKGLFTDRRDRDLLDSARIPIRCVLWGMQNILEFVKGISSPSDSFATCPNENDFPYFGAYAPCMTEDYVNLVYNSFIDATDCFDVPQKLIVPKISNESGFHVNIGKPFRVRSRQPSSNLNSTSQNSSTTTSTTLPPFHVYHPKDRELYKDNDKWEKRAGGDAGAGQFTEQGLNAVQKDYERYIQLAKGSNKPSCERLLKIPGIDISAEQITPSLDKRCHVVQTPPNPLRSFVYMAILFRQNFQHISYGWRSFRPAVSANVPTNDKYPRKLAQFSEQEENEIKNMLALLSYNSGSGTALRLWQSWVELKLHAGANIKNSDIDFTELSKQDANIRELMEIADQIRRPKRFFPELKNEDVEAKIQELKNLRARVLARTDKDLISFPHYLYILGEAAAVHTYLVSLSDFADELNSQLGQNVCVPESYLSL